MMTNNEVLQLMGDKFWNAEYLAGWIERNTTDEQGNKIKVEEWEYKILEDLVNGALSILVLLPSGSGKTYFAAVLNLIVLRFMPKLTVNSYASATTVEQASQLFNYCKRIIELNPKLDKYFEVKKGFKEIRLKKMNDIPDRSGVLKVISGDVKASEGMNISGLLNIDELHVANEALYDSLVKSTQKQGGITIALTTAGESKESLLGQIRETSIKNGKVKQDKSYTHIIYYDEEADAEMIIHEYSIPSDLDIDSLSSSELLDYYESANPSSFRTRKILARAHAQYKQKGEIKASLRYLGNMWVKPEGDNAISLIHWRQNILKIEKYNTDKPISVIGMDLAWKRDSTALIPAYFYGERNMHVLEPAIFYPPSNNERIKPEDIKNRLAYYNNIYDVRYIFFDPNAEGNILAEEIQKDLGIRCVAVPQTQKILAWSAMALSEAIVEGTVTHEDYPELNKHVENAISKYTGYGNDWYFSKALFDEKIDAVVAMSMAYYFGLEKYKQTKHNNVLIKTF